MIKSLLTLCTMGIVLLSPVKSQTQVSTTPEDKNFLIEKGTGHVCGSCPLLDSKCDSVIMTHPGRGYLILYHFGPDAVPQAPPVDKDFTTPFGDTIYDPAKLHWPFYLNMMVNRRDQGPPYGSTFIFGATNQVQAEADIVVTQPSPVNLWMSSTFDAGTRLLTVNVEAYYTAASATAMNFINVALTEDSIVATQYDPDYVPNNHFNLSFVHNNVFRDNLTDYPGDTILTTSMGSLISRTYTYTIPTMYKNVPCDPDHCNLTLYITEEPTASGVQSFTGKIQNVTRVPVGGSSPAAIADAVQKTHILYPNPTKGTVYIDGIGEGYSEIHVTDMTGLRIYPMAFVERGNARIEFSGWPAGMYMVRIVTEKGTSVHKVTLTE